MNTEAKFKILLLLTGVSFILFVVYATTPSYTLTKTEIKASQKFCELNSTQSETLDVFLLNEYSSERFLDTFCHNNLLKKFYRRINTSWDKSGYFKNLSELYKAEPELLISSQQSIITSILKDKTKYTPIANYPDYKSSFISLHSKPNLSNMYFLDKIIGLVKHPSSLSGNRYPIKALYEAGVDLKKLDIRYYESHSELRNALMNKEVHVIGSYFNQELDSNRFPSAYSLELDYMIDGPTWYLKTSLLNTSVGCLINEYIKKMAKTNPSSYFKQLKIVTHQKCMEK